MKLYQKIANCLSVIAALNVLHTPDDVLHNWKEDLNKLCKQLPSGSGWDCGTKLCECSTPRRLVFTGSYHHMNMDGFYDGWTDHDIIVTPSLIHDFDLRITGRDRNDVKDYLHDLFHHVLNQEVE